MGESRREHLLRAGGTMSMANSPRIQSPIQAASIAPTIPPFSLDPRAQEKTIKVEMKTTGKPLQEPNGLHAGRWTQEEHENFLIGLNQFGREWKKVAERIKTRTSAQIRSHAQKYFAKLAKEEGKLAARSSDGSFAGKLPILSVDDLSDESSDAESVSSSGKKRPHPNSTSAKMQLSPMLAKATDRLNPAVLTLPSSSQLELTRLQGVLTGLQDRKRVVESCLLECSDAQHIENARLRNERERLSMEIEQINDLITTRGRVQDLPNASAETKTSSNGDLPPSRQLFESLSPHKRQRMASLGEDELLAVQVLSTNLSGRSACISAVSHSGNTTNTAPVSKNQGQQVRSNPMSLSMITSHTLPHPRPVF